MAVSCFEGPQRVASPQQGSLIERDRELSYDFSAIPGRGRTVGGPRVLAVYGKGGSGKTTIVTNLAVLFAEQNQKVLLVGCDPKHDSSQFILGTPAITTVLDAYREKRDRLGTRDYVVEAHPLIHCVESGGPEPGVGCAGRGISKMFEIFEVNRLAFEQYDAILFDVLGDVVCGGFAVPMRRIERTEVIIVVSGEVLSLYAANNICRAIVRLQDCGVRLAGFIGNLRSLPDESRIVEEFAGRLGGPLLGLLPHDMRVNEAAMYCKTVVDFAPESKWAVAFREFFERLKSLKYEDARLPRPMTDLGFYTFVSARLRRGQSGGAR